MKNAKAYSLSRIIFVLFIVFLITGCATSSFRINPNLPRREKSRKILLMPMDIQLSTLTAGGVLKPEAEWTAKANMHVEKAIKELMSEIDMHLLYSEDVKKIDFDTQENEKRIQLIKLHETVGYSILLHQYIPEYKLPGKTEFDWSLGSEAKFLKEKYGVDYALFVYLRDSYASGGRVALFLIAAALGVGVPLGQQVGFASLIALETGEVLWFNRLLSGVGDLRTQKAAKNSVKLLLSDFPK